MTQGEQGAKGRPGGEAGESGEDLMEGGNTKAGLEDPPEGFRWFKSGRTFGWVKERSGFSFELLRLGGVARISRADSLWQDSKVSQAKDAAPRGRGELLKVPLDRTGSEYALVRHYRRGGLLGRFLGDRYWGAGRFFEEARITERARALGVATPEVLGVRAEKVGCGWYRGDLATRQISGSRDLADYLAAWRERGIGPAGPLRGTIVRNLAELLRRMHDAGIVHGDLNVKNLLLRVEPEGGQAIQAFVVDLDKARMLPSVSARLRAENILRLYRSLEKQGFAGSLVGWRDRMGFLRAYALGRRSMLRELAGFLRRGALGLRFHRLGWGLARLTRSLRAGTK